MTEPISHLGPSLMLNFNRFFYHPLTLTALAIGMSILAYVATTNDVLEEGRDKRRL